MEIEVWHESHIAGTHRTYYIGRAWSWPDVFILIRQFVFDPGVRWSIHRVMHPKAIILTLIWNPDGYR